MQKSIDNITDGGGATTMNIVAQELARQFEEVPAMEFYRDIFPDGELDEVDKLTPGRYTGIAVEITNEKRNSKRVIRRYTVTDDLDMIDQLQYSENFCILAPISYAGKSRVSRNARFMYALVVELDNLIINKKKEQIGLKSLIKQWSDQVHWIPRPTYLVASGTGVHLYYLFKNPVSLFPNVVKSMEKYKRELTKMVWNRHVTVSYTDENIQQESIFQAFRMVGTVTKLGDRVQAFRTGERVTVSYMNNFVTKLEYRHDCGMEEVYKSRLTKAEAKEKYPDWYENRIVCGKPKGHWICKRELYDWWKRRIREEARVGHRYYCLMMLAIYAVKCDIDRQEIEDDCLELMEEFEKLTDREDNHFTEKDVLDALQSFEDKGLITYPVNSIANRSGLEIPKNKRNYRKQTVHLRIARATLAIMNDEQGKAVQGRHSREKIVREWRELHPNGRKADCIRETGLAKHTVYKWWKTADYKTDSTRESSHNETGSDRR